MSAYFATPLIVMADLLDDQDAVLKMTIEIGKCFHPCLPLLVDTRGTLDGQAIMACLSRLL